MLKKYLKPLDVLFCIFCKFTVISLLRNGVENMSKSFLLITTFLELRIQSLHVFFSFLGALQQCSANAACSDFLQEYDIRNDLAIAQDFAKLPTDLPNRNASQTLIFCINVFQNPANLFYGNIIVN